MIFCKIEVKDLELLPPNSTPIIEHELSVKNNRVYDKYPNFSIISAYYEIRIPKITELILSDLTQIVKQKNGKGVYLRFLDSFVLGESESQVLRFYTEEKKEIDWILDFNLTTLIHSTSLWDFEKATFVLRTGK